jgi:hypothetical protein
MKNVTITMDEALVRKARIVAASEGKSLSRFIAEVVQQQVGRPLSQAESLDRFLAGPDWSSDGAHLPGREEIYEERLHRHERADLRPGSGLSDEGGAGTYVADPLDPARRGRD